MKDEYCVSGKNSYPTKEKADRACTGLKNRLKGELKSYLCRECKEWHLTSKKKNTLSKTKGKGNFKKLQEMKNWLKSWNLSD